MRDSTAAFLYAMAMVGDTHSATLCQDVSGIHTHLNGLLATLTLELSAKTSSDALGLSEALPPFYCIV